MVNACFVELEVPENAISRGGPNDALSYANFKKDEFSYLNITALGEDLVDHMPECSLACLKTRPCFSFNIETSPNINNKLLCELLPSDKYNNTDKFNHSDTFHHFSITVSWINKGKIRKTNLNPNSAIEKPQTLSSEKESFHVVNHVNCGDEKKMREMSVFPRFPDRQSLCEATNMVA